MSGFPRGGSTGLAEYVTTAGVFIEDTSADGIQLIEEQAGASVSLTTAAASISAGSAAASVQGLAGNPVDVNANGIGAVNIAETADTLGFFGATAIAQPARIGAITYTGTGTSTGKALPSITAASVDTSAASLVTVQNLAASLKAVLALFDTALSAAAGGFGLTA